VVDKAEKLVLSADMVDGTGLEGTPLDAGRLELRRQAAERVEHLVGGRDFDPREFQCPLDCGRVGGVQRRRSDALGRRQRSRADDGSEEKQANRWHGRAGRHTW
jgi:hypothetical protein